MNLRRFALAIVAVNGTTIGNAAQLRNKFGESD